MGRNFKQGLSYFPLDVDFLEDEKLQFISATFGLKGEAIIVRLLCKIYRNGYAMEWNDDVALLFARSVGGNTSVGVVSEVVMEALKRGCFNEAVFLNFRQLTSKGIQERYAKICTDAKRKNWQIDEKIDLLRRKYTLTTEEIIKTTEESTQSKEKKSKELKENKKEKGIKDLELGSEFLLQLFKPTASDMPDLPDQFVQSAQEWIVRRNGIDRADIPPIEVQGLFTAWKLQNLHGTKIYNDANAVFIHFINSVKTLIYQPKKIKKDEFTNETRSAAEIKLKRSQERSKGRNS